MRVTSEPNIVQIFVILVIGGLFFLLLGTFMIFMVAPEYPLPKQLGLVVLGLGSYTFAIGSAVNYFRSTPELTVTLDDICIKYIHKSVMIKTNDISEIHLNQKSEYKFLFFGMPMESTIIKLKNGTSFIFWDFLYDRFGRIKNAINLSIDPNKNQKLEELKKKKGSIIKPIDNRELTSEHFKSIKGNGIFNFYGLVLSVMLGAILYNMNEENMIRGIVIYLLFVGLSEYHLHYFRVSENYFQIRNFIWFWKSKTFRLQDIQEIIHEHPTKTPESIRVRLKNFHTTHLQPAGSYTEKHWLQLIDKLEELNVRVRSEYYEKGYRNKD